MAKTTCPITRAQFAAEAKPVSITVGGLSVNGEAREFSTGSLGWFVNGKAILMVGGQPVQVQVNGNLTIIGSKELPKVGAAQLQGAGA